MEKDEPIIHREYPQAPTKVEYCMSEMGKQIREMLVWQFAVILVKKINGAMSGYLWLCWFWGIMALNTKKVFLPFIFDVRSLSNLLNGGSLCQR
ncbi:MAG: winged helix-turn-helix transcriptional regulator [Lachnospiraceae bacterium]|nr:winged helix-turn-helix transcriptional regulator [Lachnospiraceae bacterium]